MNHTIDHTLLKPDATAEQIRKLCDEARQFSFASVCVNPCRVALAAELLKDSGVAVCTVIGFPLGAGLSSCKAAEAAAAVHLGAGEIDMVINIGAVKDGSWSCVEDDIRAVRAACPGQILKVIFETALLQDEEIRQACAASLRAGADFVKTSTGFGPGGATIEAVRLMKQCVGSRAKVKASGGIRDAESAAAMIAAGAERLGTSAGVAICLGGRSGQAY
ncbi:MAG: hypothetical protein RL095_215 [Verrucomicrobiota bacterium]|jgi:deoxyribose-phosphate aldolase